MGDSDEPPKTSKRVATRLSSEQKNQTAPHARNMTPAIEKAAEQVIAEHDELLRWLTLTPRVKR